MPNLEVIYKQSTRELFALTKGSPKEAYEYLNTIKHLYGEPFIIIIKELSKPTENNHFSVFTDRYFQHKSTVSYFSSEEVLTLIGDSNNANNN